mmetsp:Transcript_33037/g.87322  ORF Transcript_33037/g.87322 Transcript_33037/m.87322 type:complete len:204 (+) Transcript_33037:436-1047(+)
MADGSINSTVVFGTRALTAFATRSTSAGSASRFATLASGIWHQAFMSSSGSCSSMATRSFAHSFSRSFFLALAREVTATKPKSSLPFLPVFASMRMVTFGVLAILRGGSMPSSQRAIQVGWICNHCIRRPFGSLTFLLLVSSLSSSCFLLRCAPCCFSLSLPFPPPFSPPLLSPPLGGEARRLLSPRRSLPRLGEPPRPGGAP